jgi:hypothetical protein
MSAIAHPRRLWFTAATRTATAAWEGYAARLTPPGQGRHQRTGNRRQRHPEREWQPDRRRAAVLCTGASLSRSVHALTLCAQDASAMRIPVMRQLWKMPSLRGGITALCWLPATQMVLAGSDDGQIRFCV